MRDPFDGIEMESETSASHELGFSNRVAGNLERKSGLLNAILNAEAGQSSDGMRGEVVGQGGNGSNVIPFPRRSVRR